MKILITGASRGLGAALARRFATNPSTELFLVSRNELKLNELKDSIKKEYPGVQVHCLPFDLVESEKFTVLAERVEVFTDHLDILVNNAGLLIRGKFEEINGDQAMKMFQVNYLAPSMLIKSLLPLLSGAHKPHIVNISSMGGFQGSMKFPGLAHYSASKAAISSLTECLATEFEGRISVNCLAIGSVQTEMLEEAFPGYKAPLTTGEMAEFVADFAINGNKFMNGKILPVALTTP